MRTILYIIWMIALSSSASAQRVEVINTLNRYQIDSNVLNNRVKEKAKTMAFDLRQMTSSSNSEKVELIQYDGSKPDGFKWLLNSVNGKAPTSAQVKNFIRAHPENIPVAEIDEKSYKIVSSDNDQLVIEFNYLKSSLTPENLFMKDCKGTLFVNLNTKQLEKQQIQNQVPIKIKGISIPKLLTTTLYIFDEKFGGYLISEEKTNMVIKLLLISSDSEVISQYSNYQKT